MNLTSSPNAANHASERMMSMGQWKKPPLNGISQMRPRRMEMPAIISAYYSRSVAGALDVSEPTYDEASMRPIGDA